MGPIHSQNNLAESAGLSNIIQTQDIAKSELELKEQSVPLFIVFYDIVADRLFPKPLVEDQLTFTFKRGE